MKNRLFNVVIMRKMIGIIALCMVFMLTIIAGCGTTASNQMQQAGDETNTELTDEPTKITQTTKEEKIDAYNKSKGYEVLTNSGIGFEFYVPKKERDDNQAFFDNLNKQSRLNGYDFSSYLDKPLQYVAMAINSDDTTQYISFLCYQDQIVGVWIDGSNKDHLAATGKLLQYNFVYDNEELLKYKSKYIGDSSNVVNLMYALPYVNGIKPVSCALQTDSEPYGLIINCQGYGTKDRASLSYFKNAAVILSLIENVGIVTFNIEGNDSKVPFKYTRAEIEAYFKKDVRKYTEDKANFAGFIKEVQDAN